MRKVRSSKESNWFGASNRRWMKPENQTQSHNKVAHSTSQNFVWPIVVVYVDKSSVFSADARKHCIIYDKISPICKLQYEKNSTKTLAHNIWMKFFGKLKVQRFSIRWIVMLSQIQIRFDCFFIWSPRQRFRKYHCFWI